MTVELTLVDGDTRYEYSWQAGRDLARDMLAYLRDRLQEHNYSLADIAGIGIYRGPGSYTGLRIGMTVLNTIANARHTPIVGAIGEQWQSECEAMLQRTEDHKIVLPEYGGDAHITAPKK